MLYRLLLPLARGLLWTIFAMCGGIKRVNAQNLPKTGGVLLCPNHVCDADPAAIFWAMERPTWYMAKVELFSIKIVGPTLKFFQTFPVKRDSADRAALKRAEALLKSGNSVVIFPEGGGNYENTLQPLHAGALLIALRAKVPVVPVALKYTNDMLPYGTLRLRRSKRAIEVVYGEPMDFSDLYDQKGGLEIATQRLTVELARMLDQPVPEGKPKPHE